MSREKGNQMRDDQYKGIISRVKQFQKGPLELHNEIIKPNATYSYSIPDFTFLSQQWAKENNAYYFDIIDFLEAVHLGDTEKVNAYKKQLRTQEKVITSLLPLFTDKSQEQFDHYWLDLFRELKSTLKNPLLKERRMVVPLHIVFGDMVQHASVACFNFKPQKDAVDLIVLEQHAQKKGEPEYDAGFDYTKGIQLHAKAWTDVMKSENYGFLGIKSVNTFVNDKPICRRHDTCGVVASEVARQLLSTDDPMKLAKSGIVITDEQVDTLHARNQKLEAKYGYFPIVAVKSKKER